MVQKKLVLDLFRSDISAMLLCWGKIFFSSFLFFSFLSFLLCIIAWGFGCFLFPSLHYFVTDFILFKLSFLFFVFAVDFF
jgi:hypothetical protein